MSCKIASDSMGELTRRDRVSANHGGENGMGTDGCLSRTQLRELTGDEGDQRRDSSRRYLSSGFICSSQVNSESRAARPNLPFRLLLRLLRSSNLSSVADGLAREREVTEAGACWKWAARLERAYG